MKVQSTRFGEIEFPEELLIKFPEGILGFPEDHRYLLLEHDADQSPFRWLQSADCADLAFIVIDPLLLCPQYSLNIDADTLAMIGTTDPSQCVYVAIVNVPGDEAIRMTANLRAPLVVNPELRLGRQIISGSQIYSVQEPIFPRLNENLAALGESRANVPLQANV